MLLFDPEGANAELLAAFDAAASDDEALVVVKQHLIETRFEAGALAVISWANGVLDLVIFGELELHTSIPTAPMISGAGSATWVERHLGSFELDALETAEIWIGSETDAATDLRLGIVPASGLRIEVDLLAASAEQAVPVVAAPVAQNASTHLGSEAEPQVIAVDALLDGTPVAHDVDGLVPEGQAVSNNVSASEVAEAVVLSPAEELAARTSLYRLVAADSDIDYDPEAEAASNVAEAGEPVEAIAWGIAGVDEPAAAVASRVAEAGEPVEAVASNGAAAAPVEEFASRVAEAGEPVEAVAWGVAEAEQPIESVEAVEMASDAAIPQPNDADSNANSFDEPVAQELAFDDDVPVLGEEDVALPHDEDAINVWGDASPVEVDEPVAAEPMSTDTESTVPPPPMIPPPPPPAAPAPAAAESNGGERHQGPTVGLVEAVLCPSGHTNPPQTTVCFTCSEAIASDVEWTLIDQPSVGDLTFLDGQTVPIDRGVVIGRRPESPEQLITIAIEQAEVSRSHAQIVVEGWSALLTDLGSRNGTYVCTIENPAPVRLDRGVQHYLEDGTTVHLGGPEASFVFSNSRSRVPTGDAAE